MGRCRVLKPELTRLPLTDGDYVDVKTQLTAGEYVDLLTSLTARNGFAKILCYLVGWSLLGLDGKPLAYSVDLPESVRLATVRALDDDTWAELVNVIDAHEKAQQAAREEKKTIPLGERAS